jgi:hypothetical protein
MEILRDYCALFFYFSLTGALIAFLAGSEAGLAAATTTAGFSYAMRDYFDPRPGRLTVMSFYAAFGALWFGASNFLGYWAEGGIYEEMFFDFDIREFMFQAQIIATLAVFIPLLAYEAVERNFGARMRLGVPKIGFEVPDWLLFRLAMFFLLLGWGPYLMGLDLGFLGMLSSLTQLGSYICIFTLNSRWLIDPRPPWPGWSRWLPLLLAVSESAYFAVFGGERGRVAWPLVAFSLPYILRRRINMKRALVGVLFFAAFAFVFKQLAETRRTLWGFDRVQYVIEKIAPSEAQPILPAEVTEADRADTFGVMRLMARLSTFNQLTQVYRFAEEEGFYEGETMQYIVYVFIPRALWQGKPLVAPGQWFAAKIGRGSRLESGGFSNAINMTIPGELYLNFGWPGVIAGLTLLTVMYFLFWEAARMATETNNALGHAFAFALLYQAIFNGSHFGGVVNLTMWYLLFLGITYVAVTVIQQGRWQMFRRDKTGDNSLSILPPKSAA